MYETNDPHVALFAIKGLIRFLDETSNHIPKLIELRNHAPFDQFADAQLVAVQLAADVLLEHDSTLLMKASIAVAENTEVSAIIREDAVAALSIGLARMCGQNGSIRETAEEIVSFARTVTDRHLS